MFKKLNSNLKEMQSYEVLTTRMDKDHLEYSIKERKLSKTA